MDLTEIVKFDNSTRHPWELARLEVVKDRLDHILKQRDVNKPMVILDVGCGDAFVVGQLSRFFPQHQFVGFDINFSDDQLNTLHNLYQNSNLSIHRDWDTIDLEPHSVDVVMLLDVIEHIEDEISFMRELSGKPVMRSDTDYMITVPAYQSLFAAHDVILGHYRRYTNQMLSHRMTKAGLKTIKSGYFFTTLVPPRMIQKLMEKLRPRDIDIGSDVANWKGGETLSTLIKRVLIADYKIGTVFQKLGIKLPGLSNLAICRRLPS